MKILVIGPSWIGDMMMSQSLYRLLKRHYPDVKIDVMAPLWCSALLNYMPEVNQNLVMPIDHKILKLGQRYQLGRALRKHNYRLALVLPNSFKSALVPFFSDIPRRIGWRGEMRYGLLNDIRILNEQAFPLMVQRYAALAYDSHMIRSAEDLPKPLPYPRIRVDVQEIRKILGSFIPSSTRSLIGLCLGAACGLIKCWPHYHFATLAKELIYRNYQIVLFGSLKDFKSSESINNTLPKTLRRYCHNLVGQTTLEQAVKLIAACQGIISNDSGLMHIASALDRPLVALYGPSSPEFTPPLSSQARVIRLTTGRYKIRQSINQQQYHQSLIAIKPARVLSELETILLLPKNTT
ncbi:lipopolysaccharide heptosyltransferase II [Candidatus Curculioniphilus buchneri]|uniref:lipopolysaccharide heptosyltransferase II n=1 Tax=Candidatus Curculioniphilus buchneri TaxID=690594 RepID=UPI00376F39ED